MRVETLLGVSVDEALVATRAPDVVVDATGSAAVVPSWAGTGSR